MEEWKAAAGHPGSVLHVDVECFSTADLKKVGTENYVRAPGFAVTVFAWAFDNEPVQSVVWPRTQMPAAVREHIEAGGTIKAWNASFERTVFRLHYSVDAPPEIWDCVMIRSLAYGLPGSLQAAGDALGLAVVKDASAKRLVTMMGKPRDDGSTWHADPSLDAQAKQAALRRYCMRDVEAERALDHQIAPLDPIEQKLMHLDARINDAGVLVDRAAVAALAAASKHEVSLLNRECERLTGGAVTSPGTQGAKLKEWLERRDTYVLNMSKEEVADILEQPLTGKPDVRRVLEIRQLAAKASVSKLAAMAAQASVHDSRARGQLQFYGAGRTGRWAGRGIQIQNLPRPEKGLDVDAVIAAAAASPDAVGMVAANPMRAISGSLRGCLVARPGHVLISIDFAQIEARVLAWLAGQLDVLIAFRRGEDVYSLQAAKVGSTDRALGKVLVLACGYGMGAVKFRETAEELYGVTLSAGEALAALGAWRTSNARIVSYWKALQSMAEDAVKAPGSIRRVGVMGVAMRLWRGALQVRKPNGVRLTYHQMRNGRDGLVFQGVDGKTKQWGTQRTYGGKLVENLTQSVARDVMAEALLAAESLGLRPIATIHDEIVWEVSAEGADATADLLMRTCTAVPSWGAGLPLAAEAKISRRYGK